MHERGIDVVVTNYRTPKLLRDFVESYRFQTCKVPTTLYVMDVDPLEEHHEDLVDILSTVPDVVYWGFESNCGYSGACNWAAWIASSEVIAFFNSDTRLFEDTLDVCYDYLQQHDDVAICGPLQVDSAGLVTHAGVFGTGKHPQMRGWRSPHPERFRDNRDDAVTVSGSAYFVKREVWDELTIDPEYRSLYPHVEGAFLPTKHYYEETWCSYFARHKGYKVAYVGEALMIHEWHKSSKVGDVEGQIMQDSRAMFRDACDHFGIERD